MMASFMVDPLGLDLIDRIGVDRVMWSTDFPHNESTYGYSNESLATVVERGRSRRRGDDRRRQHQAVPRARQLMPAGLMATAPPRRGSRRSPTSAGCAASAPSGCGRIMRDQGIDALVLLGNTNVIYATGAIWPLADSGRTHFEQPVAVVLADDEFPHIWSPVRDDERLRAELPADHLHGPVYLDFDEGVAALRRPARRARAAPGPSSPSTSGPTRSGAATFFFAGGPPLDGRQA